MYNKLCNKHIVYFIQQLNKYKLYNIYEYIIWIVQKINKKLVLQAIGTDSITRSLKNERQSENTQQDFGKSWFFGGKHTKIMKTYQIYKNHEKTWKHAKWSPCYSTTNANLSAKSTVSCF